MMECPFQVGDMVVYIGQNREYIDHTKIHVIRGFCTGKPIHSDRSVGLVIEGADIPHVFGVHCSCWDYRSFRKIRKTDISVLQKLVLNPKEPVT